MVRTPPVLSGERVLLRMAVEDDAPAIVEYFERNRAHLEPLDPTRPPGFYTCEYWSKRAVTNLTEFFNDQSCRLMLLARDDDDRIIGSVNLSQIVRGPMQACYLGYGLDAEHQGRGLMTEALRLVIAYAFESLRLHRVMANYQPTNVRSSALLRRLGFAIEGYARDYLYIHGRWADHVLTSLTNEKWAPA
ncbi:MAG: GNAT family N-acetyltransferase [Phycisphaerae bacterium]